MNPGQIEGSGASAGSWRLAPSNVAARPLTADPAAPRIDPNMDAAAEVRPLSAAMQLHQPGYRPGQLRTGVLANSQDLEEGQRATATEVLDILSGRGGTFVLTGHRVDGNFIVIDLRASEDGYVVIHSDEDEHEPLRAEEHQYTIEAHGFDDGQGGFLVTSVTIDSEGEGTFTAYCDVQSVPVTSPGAPVAAAEGAVSHASIVQAPQRAPLHPGAAASGGTGRTRLKPADLTLQYHRDAIEALKPPKGQKSLPGLQQNDRSLYTRFLFYLESGAMLEQGRPIDDVRVFNALPLATQNRLLNAAIAGGLDGSVRHAINRAQRRAAGDMLQPPGGAAVSRTGPRKKRAAPTTERHLAAVAAARKVQGVTSHDVPAYSQFLALLEGGTVLARSGAPVLTEEAFDDLPLAEQNAIVDQAIAEGLTPDARQALNRVQQRPRERCLEPPGGSRAFHGRTRHDHPRLEAHIEELDSLDTSGLQSSDRSQYSAFMVHLESGLALNWDGAQVGEMARFNLLPMAQQNTIVNRAIAFGLRVQTRQAINRAQQRVGDRVLTPPPQHAPVSNPEHIEALRIVAQDPVRLQKDHGYYAAFLSHLEAGQQLAAGGVVVRTLAQFNALSLPEQCLLVNRAIDLGLHTGVRQAINRIQDRSLERALIPRGGARVRNHPYVSRPKPNFPEHHDALAACADVPGLSHIDRSCYSAFLAHLESEQCVRPDGFVINSLSLFDSLSVDEQSLLTFAAIRHCNLDGNTLQSINRIQQRHGAQRLEVPQGPSSLLDWTDPMFYSDPGAPPRIADTPSEFGDDLFVR